VVLATHYRCAYSPRAHFSPSGATIETDIGAITGLVSMPSLEEDELGPCQFRVVLAIWGSGIGDVIFGPLGMVLSVQGILQTI